MLTVIMTGGASRRMGRDKAMLPWQGKTLLQTLIDRYSAALGPVAVSVDRPGRFEFENARELVDSWPGQGPLNGLVSAFESFSDETAFFTATDLPYGEPELALRLAELMGSADACVMQRGVKGVEPLFAVYRRSCLEPARAGLEQGRKSLQRLLGGINVRYVGEPELGGFELDRILMNVNTPEEFGKASEL